MQPEYGVMLKTLSSSFNIMLFTDTMYLVGKGGFGMCYLGKLCSDRGEELAFDINRSYADLISDKHIVVVKIIPKNKTSSQERLYSKEIDNLASVHEGNTNKERENIVKVYPFKL